MKAAASIASKYPIHGEIEIPEDLLQNWQVSVDLLAKLTGISAALIMRVRPNDIEVLVASHNHGNVYHHGEMAPLCTGLYCETTMTTQRRLLVPNALADPAWDHNPDLKLGMVAYCGLPLTWPDGKIFGTICLLDRKANDFSEQTQELLERFGESVQFHLRNIYDAFAERKAQPAANTGR